MNARLGFSAKARVRTTATALVWCAAALVGMQTASIARGADAPVAEGSSTEKSTTNPATQLKSAIQQELDDLYAKQGQQAPNMMRPAGTATKQAAQSPFAQSATGTAGAARVASAPQARQRNNQRQLPNTTAGTIGKSDQPANVSEIQRQLEEMYRRDGKTMPSVDYSAIAQQAQGTLAQSQQQISRNDQLAQPQQSNRPATNTTARTGLLQRLNPFRSRGRRSHHPSVIRRSMRRNGNQLPAEQQSNGRPQQITTQPDKVEQAGNSRRPRLLPSFLPFGSDNKAAAQPIEPEEKIAQSMDDTDVHDEDLEFFPNDATADDGDDSEQLAADDTEPQPRVSELKTAQALDQTFPNPFTEVSETEADETALEQNPFANLTPGGSDEQAADEAATASVESEDESQTDTVAETDSESHAPQPIDSDIEDSTDVVAADGEAPVDGETETFVDTTTDADSLPVAESTDSEGTGEHADSRQAAPHLLATSADEKLRLIAQRVGRRGLKGFCPVTLRDHRGLANAKPEYTSVYQSKRYEFSNAEAKTRFDEHPELYAPVEGGLDVIVQAANDADIEGSLDHAVWFRDRLYLFSSRETMQAFVQQPAEYAIDE